MTLIFRGAVASAILLAISGGTAVAQKSGGILRIYDPPEPGERANRPARDRKLRNAPRQG